MKRDELAAAFYRAAFGVEEWSMALGQFAAATRSSHGQLIGIGAEKRISLNVVTDIDPQHASDLDSIEGGAPHVNPHVAAASKARVLETVWEKDLRAAAAHLKTDDYFDFERKWNVPFGCQTTLIDDADGLVGLQLLRSASDGPSTDEMRAEFALMAPHVQAAVQIASSIETRAQNLMLDSIEACAGYMFLCDQDGRLLACTTAAESLLSSGGPLQVSEGRIGPADRKSAAGFMALLRRQIHATADLSLPPQGRILVENPAQPERPLTIYVTTLPVGVRLAFRPRVVLVARFETLRSTPSVLLTSFGLTPAEVELVVSMADGASREEIARSRGRAVGTVRNQLKSIFSKLGVSREAELVAMMHGGLAR